MKTMAEPSVTMLVLGYNNKSKLIECLRSLEQTDYTNFKIVLVDNDSSDSSVEFVQENFLCVRIIKLNRNYGFIAYNYVVDKMEDEYIVLINNDIVVARDWLKTLMPYIMQESVAAVVPKLLLYRDNKRINAAGGISDIFGVGWNRGNGEIDRGQYDKVEEVFFGVGAVLLLKRSVWLKIGGFDERYFAISEDYDWSWRARIAGYKIVYVPEALAYHHWLGSTGLNDQLIYMAEAHQIANFIKNYQVTTLVRLAPVLLLIKVSKVIYLAVFRCKMKLASATLRAIWWNILNLRGSIRKRKQINALRRVSDKELKTLMVPGSLEIAVGLGRVRHPAIDSLLKK
jgi:GT2 family glycosyltransferase